MIAALSLTFAMASVANIAAASSNTSYRFVNFRTFSLLLLSFDTTSWNIFGAGSFFHFQPRETTMTSEEGACPFIASDKVVGTRVYGPDREPLGSIERVMIDLSSGCVEYAELSFGGVLGLGKDHYPIPWKLLTYDTELGGYLTHMTGLPNERESTISETILG